MVTFLLIILTIIIYLFYEKKNIQEIKKEHLCDLCESYIERRLYNELKKNDFNPIPQVRCGPYRIDLALYEYRLAIECDGKEWHSTPKQKRRDARKNYYLKKNGWKVCRLSGKTINNNIGYAIEHIKKRALS